MALTTVAQVIAFIGGRASQQEAFFTAILPGVEKAFKELVKFDPEQATATEYYDGNNTTDLMLRNWPPTSITSVHVDSNFYYGAGSATPDSTNIMTAGTDYYLPLDGRTGTYSGTGILKRIGTVWPGSFEYKRGRLTQFERNGHGNIRVVYQYGFSPIPDDIQLAIWECCAVVRALRGKGDPVDSESYEGYSYHLNMETPTSVFEQSKMQKVGTVQQILATYTRVRSRIG